MIKSSMKKKWEPRFVDPGALDPMERIPVELIPDSFLRYLEQRLKGVLYGKVEISIVEGCINIVKVERQDKLFLSVDSEGNESIDSK